MRKHLRGQNEIGKWLEYRDPEQKHRCVMMHAPRDTDTASIAVSEPTLTTQLPAKKQPTRHGKDASVAVVEQLLLARW